IHHNRKKLISIMNTFYLVTGMILLYYAGLCIANYIGVDVGKADHDIPKIFGDHRLFLIVEMANLYCILCWSVALFIFSLMVHAAHYEFDYYNEQVRSIKCSLETDEALCKFLQEQIKIHNRLTECVKHLDMMFHRYAFVMIATIIPTTIFSLFMV
ncbi:hypothetical protein PMAYCL1PPCAC_26528, partial [Pristionchus mayeri]